MEYSGEYQRLAITTSREDKHLTHLVVMDSTARSGAFSQEISLFGQMSASQQVFAQKVQPCLQ